MSIVNIADVNILNNPCLFLEPYKLEITFECIASLEDGKSHFLFLRFRI